MRRIHCATFAAVVVVGFASVASAADMPIKAPIVNAPVAVPYNWTGCYVGVNGGYGWNNGHSTYQDPNTTSDPINQIPFVGGATALFIPGPSPSEKGSLGGVTAGCNWQRQQWVFGIEGDIDAGNISGTRTTVGPRTAGDAAINGYYTGPEAITANGGFGASAQEQVSLRWLSTVRGRLGIAVQDHLLLFATGGLAVAQGSTAGFVDITIPGNPASAARWSGSNSATMVGYVVGGGAEWAFSDHWTAKVEYLRYDVGNISHPLNCVANPFGCGSGVTAYATLGNTSSSVQGSIVRVGVNYKFN
jgi:outer membrane immunogenic protein